MICWSNNKGPVFGIRVNLFPFPFSPAYPPLFLTLFHTSILARLSKEEKTGKEEEVFTGGEKENFCLPLMTSLHLRVAKVSIFSLKGWQGWSLGVYMRNKNLGRTAWFKDKGCVVTMGGGWSHLEHT